MVVMGVVMGVVVVMMVDLESVSSFKQILVILLLVKNNTSIGMPQHTDFAVF